MLNYEFPIITGAIVLIFFLRSATKSKMKHQKTALGFLMILYITFVATLTLFPIIYAEKVVYEPADAWLNLVPFKIISQIFIFGPSGTHAAQIIGNVLMTVPFGIFVKIIVKDAKWWMLFLLALAFPISIELTQLGIGLLINNMYRCIDIDDVILNTIGAYIGYSVYNQHKEFFEGTTKKKSREY